MNDATLTAKVASMTTDQIEARLYAIADSDDEGPEALLEVAKLLFGPDAGVGQDAKAYADEELRRNAARCSTQAELRALLDRKGYRRVE